MSISQVSAQQSLRATMAVAALRSSTAASSVAGTSPSTSGTRQADAINLSDTARALSTARTSVTNAPEVREDRVAALKAAIASGTYSVSSRDLAQSMIKRSWSV
jgi:negative regulator of flagellin synthesis FlgM